MVKFNIGSSTIAPSDVDDSSPVASETRTQERQIDEVDKASSTHRLEESKEDTNTYDQQNDIQQHSPPRPSFSPEALPRSIIRVDEHFLEEQHRALRTLVPSTLSNTSTKEEEDIKLYYTKGSNIKVLVLATYDSGNLKPFRISDLSIPSSLTYASIGLEDDGKESISNSSHSKPKPRFFKRFRAKPGDTSNSERGSDTLTSNSKVDSTGSEDEVSGGGVKTSASG